MNPAKSVLGIDVGKLLGHFISKDGVKIDPERVEAIKKVPLPHNKKALQYFNGQINFIRRFIPNLSELMKPTQKLLKKDVKFEWDNEEKEAFRSIKDCIARSPVLTSPDYSKISISFPLPHKTLLLEFCCKRTKRVRNNQLPL